MNDIQILIVEDEPIIADDLHFILEEMGYPKTRSVHSGEDAIKHLEHNSIDLVLLDINLAGIVDGIQVAEFIDENKNIPYIYLTSLSDDRTITRVKNTQPSGYMVKPLDEKTLKVNIELALSEHQKSITDEKQYSGIYYVKDKIRMTKILVSNIICLEGSSNYTVLHTTNKKFVISQTMKKVMSNLDPNIFVRIHKSSIINMDSIKYAFPNVEDGIVEVSLQKIEDTLILRVSDNGIGMSKTMLEGSNSFGHSLVHSLAKKLKATVKVSGSNGTSVELTIHHFEIIDKV